MGSKLDAFLEEQGMKEQFDSEMDSFRKDLQTGEFIEKVKNNGYSKSMNDSEKEESHGI